MKQNSVLPTISEALLAVQGRPGWDVLPPDPELITTDEEAIAALAGMVSAVGLDPNDVLGGVVSIEAWRRGGPRELEIRMDQRLGRVSRTAIRPPERYERSDRGTWRALVHEVLLGAGRNMTSSEITAGVVDLRGCETRGDRDYRFVERCVGSTLSRYRGKAIGPGYRLVAIGTRARGRRYALEMTFVPRTRDRVRAA